MCWTTNVLGLFCPSLQKTMISYFQLSLAGTTGHLCLVHDTFKGMIHFKGAVWYFGKNTLHAFLMRVRWEHWYYSDVHEEYQSSHLTPNKKANMHISQIKSSFISKISVVWCTTTFHQHMATNKKQWFHLVIKYNCATNWFLICFREISFSRYFKGLVPIFSSLTFEYLHSSNLAVC